jgi:DNA-binding NarL/FixJ family response regulator
MNRSKIILADDHTLVAEMLAQFLGDKYELVAIVEDGRKLVDLVERHRPALVIADISMPQLSGLDAMRRLRADGIDTPFIFLTMHADAHLAGEAMRAGASGFLLKTSAGEELTTAIAEVLRGRVYLTPLLAKEVLAAMASRSGTLPAERLTLRQREVLGLVARGLSMKEIAAALHLSPRTVETHKYDMMHALGVGSTAELVEFALQNGFVGAGGGAPVS